MDVEEKYVVVESGGSIGECSTRGHIRLATFRIFDDKDSAKKECRRMSKAYGGGYYDYHYRTVTFNWAKKNLKTSELEELK